MCPFSRLLRFAAALPIGLSAPILILLLPIALLRDALHLAYRTGLLHVFFGVMIGV